MNTRSETTWKEGSALPMECEVMWRSCFSLLHTVQEAVCYILPQQIHPQIAAFDSALQNQWLYVHVPQCTLPLCMEPFLSLPACSAQCQWPCYPDSWHTLFPTLQWPPVTSLTSSPEYLVEINVILLPRPLRVTAIIPKLDYESLGQIHEPCYWCEVN